MLGILCSLNISPSVVEWFRSYLLRRRQRICIEERSSSWCNTTAGVPQGGVLSPLLFAIFINSISYQLSSSYHLYADDLQIYCQAPLSGISDAIATINCDLARIVDWSTKYGLQVNPTQTQAIIVGSSGMMSKIDWTLLPQVSFNNNLIPYMDHVKNVGIHIDKTLSWTMQLQEVSRKMFVSAGSLRRLRNFLPITTKIALAQSLLLPILDYADISYLDLSEDQLNKLERLQNFAIRFIFGLRKYDHVSEYRAELKWLPIRFRRNAHILSVLYNILFNPSTPKYLTTRLEFLCDTHARFLRSSENLKLKMPKHGTKFLDRSFSVRAVRLWNDLPLNVRQAKSLASFKKLVKEHFMSLTL